MELLLLLGAFVIIIVLLCVRSIQNYKMEMEMEKQKEYDRARYEEISKERIFLMEEEWANKTFRRPNSVHDFYNNWIEENKNEEWMKRIIELKYEDEKTVIIKIPHGEPSLVPSFSDEDIVCFSCFSEDGFLYIAYSKEFSRY